MSSTQPATTDASQAENLSGIHVWLVMMKAYQAVARHAEHSLGHIEFCFTDFVILEALLHKGPMPINQIGDKLLLTSGSLTAAIDRLEKRTLVTRQPHATDRRTRVVHLTDTGRATTERLFDVHKVYLDTLIEATLTLDDRRSLLTLLKKLGKATRPPPKH